MNCEQIMDLLPEFASGALAADMMDAARLHLSECDVCRSELTLIALLRDGPSVPPGLLDRVSAAVRARPVARRSWGARQLTIAATFAVAMVGGAIALQQVSRDSSGLSNASDVDTSVAVVNSSVPASAAANAVVPPVLGAGSVLPELTEPQLEALLKEMGS